jgi:hypothetical protein
MLDIKSIEIPSTSLFIAKRRSGKTVLAEFLINKLIDEKKIDVVYVFGKTCKFGDNWETIEDKYKFVDLDMKKIFEILAFQMTETQKKKKNKNHKIKEVCLIFDDVTDAREGGKKGKYDLKNLFDDLFATGRHIHVSVMVLHQYIKDVITPITRTNTDYFFISSNPEEVLDYIKKLVIFDNKKNDFNKFINNNTNDNKFVAYDNVIKDNSNRWYTVKADVNYINNKKK